ncbi:glycosyltransferase involved in cell wall biosynthesis [Roseomonas alkaliterrae]|uniref:Glycosyltransferase involved in cell wall biosynthesis n=2 Tax=Neoroseomonas alkaliterrae TaxID=1452450 RepID=A0A840Y1U3_9PROT|nr:glycosyltransferase family 4 protein [Neoroseomonas alkaliterrae]MBB5688223.1 glycosyltransferase involved in cell wall biosynthesis [Neoroseomonas alkaliterrae]
MPGGATRPAPAEAPALPSPATGLPAPAIRVAAAPAPPADHAAHGPSHAQHDGGRPARREHPPGDADGAARARDQQGAARPLRILYLHQHHSTPAGSTATRSHAFAEALAARGHAVTIACGRYEGAETGLSGPFRRGRREGPAGRHRVVEFDIPCGNAMGLAARSAAFLRYAARAAPLAAGGRFDLVVASSTPLTVALPAFAARALAGTPFLFEIRDPWPELPRAMGGVPGPVLAAMERLADAACRRAAAVIALSEGMAETAIARGADPARVHVVPNGCDLHLFGPHVAPWRPPEAAPWECLALYAGAHGRANGLGALLDAAAILQARGERRLRILLVGEGAEKPALMARAAREGLANVTFLPAQPRAAVGALHAGAQIVLHLLAGVPAFAEWTSPNKLMDGLAAGRPVVTNQPGRAARIVAEGPCGIAVPPGEPALLAEALARLAAGPALRERLGLAARRQAVAKWDRRLLAERFCAIAEAAAA